MRLGWGFKQFDDNNKWSQCRMLDDDENFKGMFWILMHCTFELFSFYMIFFSWSSREGQWALDELFSYNKFLKFNFKLRKAIKISLLKSSWITKILKIKNFPSHPQHPVFDPFFNFPFISPGNFLLALPLRFVFSFSALNYSIPHTHNNKKLKNTYNIVSSKRKKYKSSIYILSLSLSLYIDEWRRGKELYGPSFRWKKTIYSHLLSHSITSPH